MTRRASLAAGLVALALAGCAQVPPGTPSASDTPAPGTPPAGTTRPPASAPPTPTGEPSPARPSCADAADALGARQRAGQLVMMGVTGTLDAAQEKALRASGAGSVILMGASSAGVAATKARTDALQRAGGGSLLVAVDQEGGKVQRLKGPGFDTIPPATQQAKLTPAELEEKAARWGRQLADAGVHLDLAPVADVVPAGKVATNQPIGELGRGYGTTPGAVAEKVVAVVRGLQRSGVAASPKHFPNLGQVVGNTDFVARVVDDVTTRDDAALEPYRRAIAAGARTVMVSTAWYTRIDPASPGAFSPAVLSILRDDLAFDGVIVSDDLGLAEAVADVAVRDRAVRFVRAGGDLAISVDADAASAMVDGLERAAEADPALAARVRDAAARVLALKAAHGLADCGSPVG